MGYPMTWKRVINRNKLVGNYGTKMSDANVGEERAVLTDSPMRTVFDTTVDDYQADVDIVMVFREHGKWLEAEIRNLNLRWGSLVGDLRRLETDAVDERAICGYIAARISVDPEVVAAVLKEFIAW